MTEKVIVGEHLQSLPKNLFQQRLLLFRSVLANTFFPSSVPYHHHTPASTEPFVGFGKKPGRVSPRYETPPGTPPPPYYHGGEAEGVQQVSDARTENR